MTQWATVQQVADAIRVSADDPRLVQIVGGVNCYLDALPLRDSPAVPEALKVLSGSRMSGYLFDAPDSFAGRGFAQAYRNSGAGELLRRYVSRRAPAITAE